MPYCASNDCHRWRPRLVVRYARLGLHVDGEWFCSTNCVASAAAGRLRMAGSRFEAVPTTPSRTGSLLVHAGVITASQLKAALQTQVGSGLRIGAELQRLGYADGEAVLSALAGQAGVSYLRAVDPACVRQAPGGLSADEVRALGVVPIRTEQKDDTQVMILACPAPLPRAAIGAVRALTGFKTVAYLVSDDTFDTLVAAYAADVPPEHPRIRVEWLDGMHDAARRIAEAATIAGDITVREARVDPLTWIRVAGKHGIEALFVMPEIPREEVPAWPVATTPH